MSSSSSSHQFARWSLTVSPETDASLREYLGGEGMKPGDLSRFVEEAVRWRLFDNKVQALKSRNSDQDDADIQATIDEALETVRPPMNVVLDTNILISALISKGGPPHMIYEAWRGRRLGVLTCAQQLKEVKEVTRRAAVALRLKPGEAGRLVNDLRVLASFVTRLPEVRRSPDSNDDYLLALAEAGDAQWLVTGDRSGLLALRQHRAARVVTARQFVEACL